MNKFFLILLNSISLILLQAEPPSDSPYTYIDFEHVSLSNDTLRDRNNNREFIIRKEGVSGYSKDHVFGESKFWISSTMSSNGKNGFGVLLPNVVNYDSNNIGESSKNRIELEISSIDNDSSYLKLEETRYYSFKIYIHPQSHDIAKETIFFQAWQNHDSSNKQGRQPPFSLSFIKWRSEETGTGYKWQVSTARCKDKDYGDKNNKTNCKVKDIIAKPIFTSTTGLEKGVWYKFVVKFKPSTNKKGAVKVWLNDEPIVAQSHERNFGYNKSLDKNTSIILDQFEVRVGAYRGRLKDENIGKTILIFDEIKIGNSYDQVNDED